MTKLILIILLFHRLRTRLNRRRRTMKTLLLIAGLIASAFTLQAQNATNITLSILVEEGGARTNTLTLTLSDLHSLGVQVAWIGSTNSYRNQVRQEIRDRLESLRTEGRAYQLKTNKIDLITTSILANWDTASAADRKLLTDWLAKYPVAP